MRDFTINVTKGAGRAAIICETAEAIAWLLNSGMSCVPLDKSRAVSYVDETLVQVLRDVLSAEGFFVEVNMLST